MNKYTQKRAQNRQELVRQHQIKSLNAIFYTVQV